MKWIVSSESKGLNMSLFSVLAVCMVCIVALVPAVNGASMYEDEILIKDWVRPLSGIPNSIEFLQSSKKLSKVIKKDHDSQKSDVEVNEGEEDEKSEETPQDGSVQQTPFLLVSYPQNSITVIGSGDVSSRKWRQVLPATENLISTKANVIDNEHTEGVLSLSFTKSTGIYVVRQFDIKTGFQEFELPLRPVAFDEKVYDSDTISLLENSGKIALVGEKKDQVALALYGTQKITFFSVGDKGRLIWEIDFQDENLYEGAFKDVHLFDFIQVPGDAKEARNPTILAFGIESLESQKLVIIEISFNVRNVKKISLDQFKNIDQSKLKVDVSYGFLNGNYVTKSGTPFDFSVKAKSFNVGFKLAGSDEFVIENIDFNLEQNKSATKTLDKLPELYCKKYGCSLDTVVRTCCIKSDEAPIVTAVGSTGEDITNGIGNVLVIVDDKKDELSIKIVNEEDSNKFELFKLESVRASEFMDTTGGVSSVYYSGMSSSNGGGNVVIKTQVGDLFYVEIPKNKKISLDSGKTEATSITDFAWFSEESLTDTHGSLIVDLALDKSNKTVVPNTEESTEQLREFRKSQIFDKKFSEIVATNHRAKSFRVTNKYGTKKIALFGSKHGRLSAIDTEYGSTLYGISLSTYLNKKSSVKTFERVDIFNIISARSASVQHNPIVYALSYIIRGVADKTLGIFEIDASTGDILTFSEYDVEDILDVIPIYTSETALPQTLNDGEYDTKIGLVRRSKGIKDILSLEIFETAKQKVSNKWIVAFEKTVLPRFFYYEGDNLGSTELIGYSSTLTKDKSSKSTKYTLRKSWKISFPQGEVIAAISSTHRDEPIASLGRILGDRNVLYKYLNPNLISTVTIKEDTNSGTSSTQIYLIDSVSGNIHSKNVYPGAGYLNSKEKTGIYLHQTENIVAVIQFNRGFDGSSDEHIDKHQQETGVTADNLTEEEAELDDYQRRLAKRLKKIKKSKSSTSVLSKIIEGDNPGIISEFKGVEIVILEIYESVIANRKFDEESLSSFDSKTPSLLQRSFIFPEVITGVGSTITGHGITTKEFVFTLSSGKLVSVSKMILNARRPISEKLSSEDQEEMLILYKPNIEWKQIEILSYGLRLPNIERVLSSSTRLESTSLILSYGLDIYCSQRSPSQTFDILSREFNYGLLVSTIILLMALVVFTKNYASRSELAAAWR